LEICIRKRTASGSLDSMGKAGTFLLVRLIKVLRIKAFVDSELRSLGRLEILRLLISKIQFMEKVKMTNSPSYVKAAGRGEGNEPDYSSDI